MAAMSHKAVCYGKDAVEPTGSVVSQNFVINTVLCELVESQERCESQEDHTEGFSEQSPRWHAGKD